MHSFAWVGWLGAALVALSTTRNPLHLALILLCVVLVNATARSGAGARHFAPISPIRLALIVIPLSALFNGLTVHFGDTVLLRLPKAIPVLGGAITVEALAFGMLNGLVLAGMLLAFATLNQALPIRALIRLIPRAFYPVAVVISIGVTFVPVTMRQLQQIREAQAVRGHRVRGLRDWVPLLMPLLISGLERALQLAEAMTARGFAASDGAERYTPTRVAVVGGLTALLSGWLLRLVWGKDLLGWALMGAGGALIVGVLWLIGRRTPHTNYRPRPWRGRDSVVAAAAALVVGAFALPGLNRAALVYYPYPRLGLPGFDPLVGVATLGLLAPAVFLFAVQQRDQAENAKGRQGVW